MRRGAWLWILLGAAVLASWIYLRAWPQAPYPSADTPSYLRVARGLATGGLAEPEVRTPGYPLLLVLAGASRGATRDLFALQLVLQLAAVFLACATLRGIGATEGLTLAVGLIGLLPPYVLASGYMLTETLTQCCLVLGIFCVARFLESRRVGWLLGASAGFGYAALTRPTFQLLALGLGLVLVAITRWSGERPFRARDALALMAGTAVLVGAWVVYNEIHFGVPGTTSTLGVNLANLGPDLYEGIPDPTTRRLFVDARNAAYLAGEPVAWAHFSTQPALQKELGLRTGAEVERWVRRQMVAAILSHPIQYAQIVAGSLARFWFPATGTFPLLRERPLQLAWYGLHVLLMALLCVELFCFGAWITTTLAGIRTDEQTRRAWILWTLCAAVVAYNAFFSCALETGETRYRMSTEILLPLTAAAGLVASRGLFRALAAIATKMSRAARAV